MSEQTTTVLPALDSIDAVLDAYPTRPRFCGVPVVRACAFEVFERLDHALLAHQANCYCMMRAGFARAVAARYPNAEHVDALDGAGTHKLGRYSLGVVPATDDRGVHLVANMYTQARPGGDSGYFDTRATSYDAVCDAWTRLCEWMQRDLQAPLPVVLPYKYGSDIAGGRWSIVSAIIAEVTDAFRVPVCACQLPTTK